MIVLGLNGGFLGSVHDAAAALVVDGEVLAAVEEERLSRRKRAFGMHPFRAAREVLDIAAVDPREVDMITYPWDPEALGARRDIEEMDIRSALIDSGIAVRGQTPVEFVVHHVAHAWIGLGYVDSSARQSVTVVALDGGGESTAGAGFQYRDGLMSLLWHLDMKASPGAFYEAATVLCAFKEGDEGKTMGLASYDDCATMVAGPECLKMQPGPLPLRSLEYSDAVNAYLQAISEQIGTPRTFVQRAHTASCVQATLEQFVWEILDSVTTRTVVLVGGIALNCSMNGLLARQLALRGQALIIPPPASDTGVALGSALSIEGASSAHTITTASLGRSFSIQSIAECAHEAGYAMRDCSPVALVDRLLSNQIVGWFDGRAEVGPRALGARCIIARTDSSRVRDRLNMLKGREMWRPLAPSVTQDEFTRSFTGIASEYMLKASQVNSGAVGFAGVTHVDGTARPQVVGHVGPYLDVLKAMGNAGAPEAVTCTSFNSSGCPMVYTPEDALLAARTMQLDAVAGDGWLIDLKKSA